ncbi:MAG: Mannose-1-phosphate guanylyltransferase [Candidatus Roizmanbacteria bacterium GW2011_GWA2_36_23]|uniref:Mannose-1-phosphate guanylyltransferase n=1 Tax=Candidatus Roizmanbacteria bacterium GW2011_GWA2_36_23 TaxID=1618480 RepID=A0A0G0GQW5_9BACT|nr:MAG: Mannose-1-phosphate guanylyltransferase [Candidatus Roizmanbacteria bacterium GW2011_GWA2_36_23]
MKAVIFAGGVGTRLWPLSRKKSPKQFEKIIGNKSTLQLAIDRLRPEFSTKDIFIATGEQYTKIIRQQLKFLPKDNIIGEPEKKDVGPAVALVMGMLAQRDPHEPVAILWSDHLVQNVKRFIQILKSADKLLQKDPNKIVFIGQKPRFASDNLGWIESGTINKKIDRIDFLNFVGTKYRPNKDLAEKYFKNDNFSWNLGYFVSTPGFILSLYQRFFPRIFKLVKLILNSPKDQYADNIKRYYHQMPEINFDNAILEQLDREFAYVVVDDIGWSDVGAWEALKEALEKSKKDNISKGRVYLKDCSDNLVYNFNNKKLIVGVDLHNMLVVDTNDVLLIANKNSVTKIKKLVESFKGTENERLT